MSSQKPQLTSGPDHFDSLVAQQKEEAATHMDKVFHESIGDSIRLGSERGGLAVRHIEQLYAKKSAELHQALLDLRGLEVNQADELLTLQDDYLAKLHYHAMNSLVNRFELMIEISGGEDRELDTLDDLQNFFMGGFAILEDLDVQSLLAQEDKDNFGTTVLSSYYESVGETLSPDYVAIMEHLNAGLEPTEEQWAVIIHEVRNLREARARIGVKRSTEAVREHSGIVLFAALQPHQRLALLEQMIAIGEPEMPQFITTLTAASYLTIEQGLYLVDEQLRALGYEPDKIVTEENRKTKRQERRAARKQGSEIESYKMARERLLSPQMGRYQEGVAHAEERFEASINRQYGTRMRVKELLSVKGIASMALTAAGAATFMANVLKDITDPWNMIDNWALWAGAGATTAGLEWNDGFAGLMDKPSEKVLSALGNYHETLTEDDLEAKYKIHQEYSRVHPDLRAFYESLFTSKRNIALTFESKQAASLAKGGPAAVPLTLEDLGMDYDELPPRFKKFPRKKLEAFMSEWAYTFHSNDYRSDDMEGFFEFNTHDYQGIPRPETKPE